MTARIRIVLGEGARMPTRATPGSAGLDLYASRDTWVPAGECVVVPTGVRLEIPAGYEGQVRGRSGLTRAGSWCTSGRSTATTAARSASS